MRQLHALLGDPPEAAVLEVLGGGLRLRAEADHRLAVTGGIGPVHVEGEHVEHGRAFVVHAGQELVVGPVALGVRAYVGVAGGVEVDPVLGSRSADTLSGLGPPRLAADDVIAVGPPAHPSEIEDVPALLTSGVTTVAAVPGPRDDWFTGDAVRAFFSSGGPSRGDRTESASASRGRRWNVRSPTSCRASPASEEACKSCQRACRWCSGRTTRSPADIR